MAIVKSDYLKVGDSRLIPIGTHSQFKITRSSVGYMIRTKMMSGIAGQPSEGWGVQITGQQAMEVAQAMVKVALSLIDEDEDE